MTKFDEAARLKVTVQGQEFTMHRKSTFIMAQIDDAQRIFGLVRATLAGKSNDLGLADLVALQRKTLEVALIDPPLVTELQDGVTYESIAHAADSLFQAFWTSGLSLDPTPQSSGGKEATS